MLEDGEVLAPIPPAPFVELGVASPFSFLRGASDAIELVLAAHAHGMDSIGVADRDTLAGVVRIHSAAKGAGLRPLIGCRLIPVDAPQLLAYPLDRDGYGRLSRLLSLGKMRCGQGRMRPDAERDRRAWDKHRLHRHAGRRSR